MNYATLAFPILTVILLLLFFFWCREVILPRRGTLEWITLYQPRKFDFTFPQYRLARKDLLPMLVIILVYGLTAFLNLGDTRAPQTFYTFSQGESCVVELDHSVTVSRLLLYTGGYHGGGYTVSFSADGKSWSEEGYLEQTHADLYKWFEVPLAQNLPADSSEDPDTGTSPQPGAEPVPIRYIRIQSDYGPLCLGEIGIYNELDQLVPAASLAITPGYAVLIDEQDVVPYEPSYLNSMYFDEIYHGRTAYEHIHNIYPYEVSHPPLGKLIIALGITMFGMTPFGWRFMGVVFGIAMLLVLYTLIKTLFGKTKIAVLGTVLFAFDFMHFVQTRIATIDTYGVFFMLLMFLCMLKYLQLPDDAKFRKSAKWLFLSGLFFGIGIASKWTVFYGGAGLLVLLLLGLLFRLIRQARKNELGLFFRHLGGVVLVCLFSFILLPACIYVLSYIPYGLASGMSVQEGMLWNPDFYAIILKNQQFMFSYHSKLQATHSYGSTWWMWMLDIRPILYYLRSMPDGYKSAFGAFGNPVVYWGGLMALVGIVVRMFRQRDARCAFILVGYLSMLLPWVFISRVAFAYHYFPCVVFLTLAICAIFDAVFERVQGKRRWPVYAFVGFSVLLFILFYPVLTGLSVPRSYTTNILKWFPSWPF